MKKLGLILLTFLAISGCSDKRESDVDVNFNPGHTAGGSLAALPSNEQTNENTPFDSTVPVSLNNQLPPPVFSVVNQPVNGTVNLNSSTGHYTYTPNLNYSGPDLFTWQVTQGSQTVTASVNINVIPINSPPVANSVNVTTLEDTPITGTLTGSDPNSDPLTFSLATPPNFGTVVINPNGTYTYTPNPNYNGPDSFSFQVNDGVLTSPPATVSISVTPVNDAPVAHNQSVATPEDTPLHGNLTGSDVEGSPLTYNQVSGPSHGTLTINPTTGAFTYVPNLNYNGPDSFTYTVSDGDLTSPPATVSINVTPVNDPPVALADSFTTPEDTLYSGVLNAIDPDGDLLTYTITSSPTKGLVTIQDVNLGTFTYQPYLNETGTDSFTFKVNDGSLDSPSVTIHITITPVNDAPVAHNSAFSLLAGATHNGNVLATDVDSGVLTYIALSLPTKGTLTFNPDGSYTYVADSLASGSDSFTFKANDGLLDSNVATVSITIGAVNNPPVANNATITIPEDSVASGNLVGTDLEMAPLTYLMVDTPDHGVLVLNPDGSYTYTPNLNYHGTDSFTFKVNDGTNDSNIATVSITVTPVNDLPIANNASYTIDENQVLPIALLASDVDGDLLTYIIVTNPSNGTLSGTGANVTYTPNLNYNGPDSFTFKVNDGTADSNVATIAINISSVNQAPVAANQSLTTPEDTPLPITLLATDADGDTLTYTVLSLPSYGTLSGSGSNWTYTPNLNYNGPDSFTFKASDASVDSNTATISINVTPVNDAPTANNLSVTTPEETPIGITLSGGDIDGDPIFYTIITYPQYGTLTGSGNSWTYTPNLNYNGTDNFTYKVNDGTTDSATATVTITVTPVNDAPIANNQSLTTLEDTPLNITLTGTDVDGDTLTYIIVTNPSNGTLSGSGANVIYTPNLDYNGPDSFTFKVNDGLVDSTPAIVTINVTPVNDIPVANGDSFSTPEDTPYSGTLTGSDPEGAVLTYIPVTPPSKGVLVLNPDGTFTYTPNLNETGSDSFTFIVNDGTDDSIPVTVLITITPVNDAPVAHNQSLTTPEDSALNITLTGVDVDGDSLTYIIVAAPSSGTLSGSGANIVYTPNPNYNGSDSFTYKVNDGSLDSNVATISITVTPENDAPVAANQSVTTLEDTAVNITLAGVDVDGDTLTYTIVDQPLHGTLSGTGANIIYTPNLNYNGPDSFTFKVNDGTVDSNIATVSINVTPVNDAPLADNQNLTTPEDTALNITLTGSDTEGDTLSYIIVSNPTNGTLSGSGANLVYTPNLNYNGTDSFTFKVNDGTVDSAPATISINVTPVNDAPVANNQSVTTLEDTPLNITLVGTDVDGDSLTYTVVDHPQHGTLSGSGANVIYTPNLNYNGTDSFTFKVNDGTLDSNIATVSINVTDENDAPVAVADSVTTPEDTPINISLQATDVDGDSLTYIIVTPPVHGTVILVGNDVTYIPDLNYNGPDSFTFKVNDGTVDSNTATISINVTPVNDAPVAYDSLISVGQGITHNDNMSASDVEGNSLTYTVLSGPTKGVLNFNATTGAYDYTANILSLGQDTFTFKVNDGSLDSNVATVTININPVNIPPIANSQTLTTPEDTNLSATLTYVDLNLDVVIFTVVDMPTHGSLTYNVNTGSFTYVPNLNYNGPDSFTFKVNDGSVDSNIATVYINVTPVDDEPIAYNQNLTTPEDTALNVTLVGTDAESAPLTYIVVSGPTNGVLSGSGENLVYTPNSNYHGTDSFTFKVNDGSLDSNIATVNITVTPVNDVPVAYNQSVSTPEDTNILITLVASDADGDLLTYTIVAPPTHGTITLVGNDVTYVPDLNYNGPDSFTFKVNDGTVDSNIATVSITVDSVNDIPVADNQSLTTPEDTALNITLTGTDGDGDLLTYIIVSNPTNGTLSGSGSNIVYTPNGDYHGTDSFTFKVNDGTVDSNVATISITVTPVNDLPVADNQSVTTDEDTAVNITLTASDADGDLLTYIIVGNPTNGTLSGSGANLVYTPNANYHGSDSFTFKVNDGTADSNTATVAITVNSVNDIPVAYGQNLTTPEDTALNITLVGTDADGDSLTYIIISNPTNGTLSGSGSNVTYTPNPNYHGTDSFTFKVNDGTEDSAPVSVVITVTPVNDIPVAYNQSVSTPEDTPLYVTLTASDADGDLLTYIIVSNPTHGVITLVGNDVTYIPDPNYHGPDSFTFKVNDGTVDSNTATVSITVDSVNDIPVANNQSLTTPEDTPLNITLTGSDEDGDTLTYIIVTNPANGTLSGTGANLVYTPNSNYHGPDSFTFKINDGTTDSNIATVVINVTPVNDVPVAYNQSLTTPEDTALNITLTASDADGDLLTYTVISGPTNGTLSGTGSNLTYTPNLNYHGSDSFTFKVNDGTVDSNIATVAITVDSINDVPVAYDQNLTTAEDTALSITLTGTDADGDALTYIIVSNPIHGTLSGTGANIIYTPNWNYNGPDSFSYKVNDGSVDSNVATININVTSVNDAPVASGQSLTTPEDTALNITLTASDADGDVLTYTIVSGPTNGVLSGTGANLVYTPNLNYHGPDSFTFKVNDGTEDSNTATVSINVTPVNDNPIANNQSVTTPEDTPINITVTASDVDGDVLGYTIVSGPTNGTLSGAGPNYVYTPNLNYHGSDSFTFKVNDGSIDSNIATVGITVTPVNDAPVADNQSVTTPEDTALNITLTASDAEGDSLTYTVVSGPTHGTLSGSGANLTYTPNLNYNGTDSFTFKVNDGSEDSNTATISINVTPVNDAPIALDQNLNTDEDTALNITLTGTDVDGDSLTYMIVSGPTHGTLSGSGANLIYTPNLNYNGNDSFTFKVNDGTVDSNVATINIYVDSDNDTPVASNQSVTTPEDTNLLINLVASDIDGDPLTYIIVTPPTHGSVVLVGSDVTYIPDLNYNGPDSFTFKVNDGEVDSNIATVSIAVTPVNDAPVANNSSFTTNEDTVYNGNVTGSDVEGSTLTYIVVTPPTKGVLVLNPDGTFTYTPNLNETGSDSFTFKVNDGDLDSPPATVAITITPVNDAPIANNQSVTTDEDTAVNITLTGSDVEGDTLTYIIVTNPSNGTLSGTGENIVYTPNLNYHGPDSFTFKVNDGTVDSNIATVSITVNAINDAPVAANQSVTTDEDTSVDITLVGTDVDGDNLTYIIVTNPTNGTVLVVDNVVTYIPDPNYHGPDSFTFKVNDGTVDSNIATVSITVDAVNDLPVANNQNLTTDEDTALNITLTATDADGDTLVYTIVGNPSNGTLSGSGANVTYTPNLNYHGTDSFTFKVNDGTGDSNIATISITINSVNDTPVANNQSVTTLEDTPINISVVANDDDGDSLTYTIVTPPLHGTITGTGPNYVYTPDLNYNGPDSFTFKVNDGTVDSNTATVSINVTPVNDTPVADNQSLTAPEDTALNITLTASDADGDSLTYSVVSGPTNGTLSGTGANITYTPNLNYHGTDSFTFKVNDGTVDSNTATVSINITPVNDAPVASNQSVVTDEDTAVNITLVGTDVDGDSLTYIIVDQPQHGTLSGTGANITYTPNLNYNGPDSFTFKVNDGTVDSNVATVSITVDAVNDLPVANNQNLTTEEDTALNITLTASDADGDTLTYIIVTNPANGTLSGSGANITYTPNLNYHGTDSFTFKVNDGTGDSNVATVSITINSVNDTPVANNQNVTTPEDTALNISVVATDVDGDTLTYTIVSGPTHGTITGAGPNYTYTPDLNYNGPDSFTYKVNDGSVDSNTATISINVTPVNDAPVANNQSVTTPEDTNVLITLVGTDEDGDTLIYTIVTPPVHGSITLVGNDVTYIPNLNYNGPDSFTFKVNDGTVDSNVATVSITVTPVNDAPVANNSSFTTNEDTAYNGNVTGSDVEGSPLTFLVITPPTKGTLVLNPDGTFTYTPNLNENGTDSFTFKVNDGDLDSAPATVAITITPVNDAPIANNQSVTTPEDTNIQINLVGTDADGDLLTYIIVTNPSNGSLVQVGPDITYIPNLNYNGSDSFTFKVNDGTVDSNVATVSITVTPVNDAPVANNQSISTNKNQAKTGTATGSDVDGDTLTYSVVTNPSNGTVSLNPTTGGFTYTPNNNFTGSDSFTFRVNDGTVNSNTATVSITVMDPNQAPIAMSQNLFGTEDTPYNGNMPSWDPDGDPITWTVLTQPTHGTLTYSPTTGNFTYVPDLNYFGVDTFTYKVNDGSLDSNIATTTINLQAINDLPVSYPQSVTVNQNSSNNPITLVGSDVETPEPSLIYSIVDGPSNGTLSGTGSNRTYTPNANFSGTDTFTFKVNDGQYDSNISTVTITVTEAFCDSSFNYTHKLVLNNQDQSSALTNFPVMVKLNSSRINYSDLKAGGEDLRFYSSNCTLLAYEIERWNTSGDSFVWVKVPSIAAANNNSYIWMSYGKASATDAQNKTAVWDSNYAAVYHLEEVSGLVYDSTSSANNATSQGSVVRNVGGRVAGGDLFDSSNDRLQAPNSNSLRMTTSSSFTLETWVYVVGYGSNANVIEKQYSATDGAIDYGLYVLNGYPHMRARSKSLQYNTQLPLSQWVHLAATFNTSSNTCILYVNGVQKASSTGCTDNLFASGTQPVYLGGDQTNRFFNGGMDEARISNIVRSPEWIRAQHLTMTDGMVSYGSRRSVGQSFKHALMTIKANNDDGYINAAGSPTLYQSGSNGITYQGAASNTVAKWGYYRFQLPAAIPSSAVIKSAKLRLYGRDGQGTWTSHYLTVTVQNNANAGQITAASQYPGSGVTVVSSSVNWGNPSFTNWLLDDWNDSPDMTSVIDTLKTNQGGLNSGNYIQVWVSKNTPLGSGVREKGSEDFNYENINHAQLMIEWE